MAWLEFIVDCNRDIADRLSDLLFQAGAVSVSLSNACEDIVIDAGHDSTPLWTATRVRGLFAGDADAQALKNALLAAGFDAPNIRRVEDRDWEHAWQQHVSPQRHGQRLWILPSFSDEAAHDGACVRLDPGLAFGTGTHPTTALCLDWLDARVRQDCEVIDYGCGSGILGIAAVKLGARDVRCVDNDPGALDTALENARRNGVDERVRLSLPEQLSREPADLLVANIFSTPLIDLAADLAALVKTGGGIALSGILTTQADAVVSAYDKWIAFEPAVARDGWIRLSGERRPVTKNDA